MKKRFLELRAHHILCIQGFVGYGYDGQFTENLSQICSELKSGKIKKVKLINNSDLICKSCPYCTNEICVKRKDGKINDLSKIDLKVLKILKVGVNKIKPLIFLINLTNENSKVIQRLKKLCGKCEWKSKCLWYCKQI